MCIEYNLPPVSCLRDVVRNAFQHCTRDSRHPSVTVCASGAWILETRVCVCCPDFLLACAVPTFYVRLSTSRLSTSRLSTLRVLSRLSTLDPVMCGLPAIDKGYRATVGEFSADRQAITGGYFLLAQPAGSGNGEQA